MLLQMVDGGILNIKEDKDYISGCPTCNYGRCYINCFDFQLSTLYIHIGLSQDDEYLSEGYMMKIILPNVNEIQKMTEKDFSIWLKEQLQKEIDYKLEYVVS